MRQTGSQYILACIERALKRTWFMNLAVKDMPNLTGVTDRPRFFHRFSLLKASTAARLRGDVKHYDIIIMVIMSTK
jgi:hypothetical protein